MNDKLKYSIIGLVAVIPFMAFVALCLIGQFIDEKILGYDYDNKFKYSLDD